MTVDLTKEELQLLRESVGNTVIHVATQLAQRGMPLIESAMDGLARLKALDAKLAAALDAAPEGQDD